MRDVMSETRAQGRTSGSPDNEACKATSLAPSCHLVLDFDSDMKEDFSHGARQVETRSRLSWTEVS